MALFIVRDNASLVCERLEFVGGQQVANFLTPEETGRSIVSPPVDLEFGGHALGCDAWDQFENETWAQLVQGSERGWYTKGSYETENSDRDQYRIVISSTGVVATLNRSKEQQDTDEAQPDEVEMQVKVKLISGIPLTSSRAQREQSRVARLARICGPQNASFWMVGLDAVNERDPSEELTIQLSWNEKDLRWETADTIRMNFAAATVENFGKHEEPVRIYVVYIDFEPTNAGVAAVLQRQYEKRGEHWREHQQQLLETGEFADMQVICEEGSNGNAMPIKCHRMLLAGTSPIFAKMLEEGRKWKEAETRTLQLAESEETIQALLHFIYYGGCDRIYRNRVDVILELLEAGEKYDISSLIDVTSFVLLVDAKEENWFTLDAAVALYHFVQGLDGEGWNKLRRRSVEMIRGRKKEERDASVGYQKFHQLATKLGPVFLYILEHGSHSEVSWKPISFPKIDNSRISLEEADFMYKFLSYGHDFQKPRNLDVIVGIIMLAEFCGKPIPRFTRNLRKTLSSFNNAVRDHYQVDYLVELFCTLRKREGATWRKLKMWTAKHLNERTKSEPDEVSRSTKYRDMLETPDAFVEFNKLCAEL